MVRQPVARLLVNRRGRRRPAASGSVRLLVHHRGHHCPAASGCQHAPGTAASVGGLDPASTALEEVIRRPHQTRIEGIEDASSHIRLEGIEGEQLAIGTQAETLHLESSEP